MKNRIRIAAALGALAVASPALPCGLHQTTADAKGNAPAVAKARESVKKVAPSQQVAARAAEAGKKATVAKN